MHLALTGMSKISFLKYWSGAFFTIEMMRLQEK